MPGWKALEETLVEPMSAAEIMKRAGVPNLLEGRKIHLFTHASIEQLASSPDCKSGVSDFGGSNPSRRT